MNKLVWLVDYDGKEENLALMRLATYHKQQGDMVKLKRGKAWPELFETPDRVYISCLFRWHRRGALRLAEAWGDKAEIGGSGVNVEKILPSNVAVCKPDYELYGENRAIGFISRGCPNKCPWCLVSRKEGKLKRVSTAQEIVGNFQEAEFLDNNFLALSDCAEDLEWLAKEQIIIDFNQALDVHQMAADKARLLAACKWPSTGIRFALDSPSQKVPLARTVSLLEEAGIRAAHVFVYVLIGYSGLESDIDRLLFARSLGVRAFPMGFRDIDTGEEPARGWNREMYKRYRRLIIRIPHAKSMWDQFKKEMEKA